MSTASFGSSVVRAALFLAIASSTTAAQDSTARKPADREPSALARRSAGSFTLVQSRPQGAFARNVGLGYGVDGAYLFRLDDAGIWSIRVSAGIVSYGSESRRTPLSEAVGGRVLVDVKTGNYLVPMSIGPQVTWPTGSIRPYANAGIGGQAFFTESHLEGADDLTGFASTTNHSSFTASWSAGAGVYVPIHRGRTNVELDLGVQYLSGGTTRYLAPGSITDLPGAQISITPLESTTHLMLLRFGARIGR